MTEEQFTAHNRDMLAWTLAECPFEGIQFPPADQWTGCDMDEMQAEWDDEDGRPVAARFETLYESRRGIGAKLQLFFATKGSSVTFEAIIPPEVVNSSKMRVLA